MKALIYEGIEKIGCRSVPDPEIESSGDVIVRVERAGLCGSDLHVYYGREQGLDAGTVMGHELLGEVVEIGPGVERLAVGDRVVAAFSTSCGRCWFCASGLTSRCRAGQLFGWVENGRGLHGAQAELARIPLADTSAVVVPRHIDPDCALFVGDILSTGRFGVELSGARPGQSVCVIGCGPVGLMAILCAIDFADVEPHAFDPEPERRARAASFGALILESREEAVGAARSASSGGFDCVIEAVGTPDAQRLAFELVRPGGTIGVVGVHTAPRFSFTPAEAYDKNVTYRVGRCPARRYIEELLPMVERRERELRSVVSHRLPLSDGPAAYAMFGERRPGWSKALLVPGH